MSKPFIYASGQTAHDVNDLVKLCQQFPDDSIYYLTREDFEKWLSYIGATEIAQCAIEARQSDLPNRQRLDLFLAKVQPEPISKEKPVATAAPSEATPPKPKTGLLEAIANIFKSGGK